MREGGRGKVRGKREREREQGKEEQEQDQKKNQRLLICHGNNSNCHEIPHEDDLYKNKDSITAATARFARALCILTVVITVCFIGVNYH